jgi:hypothetical protein
LVLEVAGRRVAVVRPRKARVRRGESILEVGRVWGGGGIGDYLLDGMVRLRFEVWVLDERVFV